MPLGKLFKKKEQNELDDEADLLGWSKDEGPDAEDEEEPEETGLTSIGLSDDAPVAGVGPDGEGIESGDDSLQATAPVVEEPQERSADDQLLGIFDNEVAVDETLETLTSLVEDVTAGDLVDDIQSLIEELERL